MPDFHGRPSMNEVLVLYYSRQGSTAALARQICRGVAALAGTRTELRTVARVTATTLHGGQESLCLSMMVPLLHHGIGLVGLPFFEAGLEEHRSGGKELGASHVI